MEQTLPIDMIAQRLDALESIVSSLRDDLAHAIERNREDFEDLNAELDNRFRQVDDLTERNDERQRNSLGQLERLVNTDLDRIRYDVSCVEARCSNLELSRR